MLAVSAWLTVAVILMADAPNDPIDDLIEFQRKAQHLPGLSLAVVKDGKVVKSRGYGSANLELSVAATGDSVYEIASLTKQFSAAAIMMLSHEKKLALDDPASRFIPEFPEAWKGVTVRHLATHTSGLPDFGDPVPAPRLERNYSHAQLAAHYARAPVKFKPGDDWAYNDLGYFLVGMIIEKASGVPYATYMTEHIFRPLRMTSTRIYSPTEVVPNRVAGYTWKDGHFLRGSLGQTGTFGGGDILSTVNDLSKWDAALDGDKLLPLALRQQLWAPARLNDGRPAPFSLPIAAFKGSSYGFGWLTGNLNGHRFHAHGGDISSGFSSFMTRFPDDRVTVIVLVNRSQSENPFGPEAPRTWEIAHSVAGHYLPDLQGLVPNRTTESR